MKKALQTAFFSCLALIFCASAAFAATTTIRPDGQGNYAGWANTGCSAGSSEWQCVDENPANTSDYLSATGTARETFTFGNPALNNTSTINSVTLYYYAQYQTSSANSCFAATVRSGGTNYDSGVQKCANASYALYSHVYATNPATGSAWTIADVNALEAGMYGLNPNGGGRVAQVYAVVDYNNTAVCGNNIIESGEVCDGTALGGATCGSRGHDGGTLSCLSTCNAYDETACYDNSCSDTDGGFNTGTQGNVSGNIAGSPYNFVDVCLDSTHVLEYFCSGENALNSTGNCTTGNFTSCSMGACI